MTSDSPSPPPILTCAENISILHLLHPVPGLPSRNPIVDKCIRHDGYSLPFHQERRLVGILAFLSSLTDGPDHIPAVCVEENSSNASLRVLIAVNKRTHKDGSKVLSLIKEGFESIFAVLGQISDAHPPRQLQDAIFAAIISMCSARILCRLRFVPNARKKTKKPFRSVLEDTVHAVRQLHGRKDDQTGVSAGRFEDGAKDVIKLIDSWKSYQSEGRLKDLVLGVHQLSQIEGLEALLNKVPHRDIDPSSKTNLVNIIRKVARYRDAARFLCRKASKFPIVRNMAVVLAQLPEAAFRRVPRANYAPMLASAVTRFEVPQGRLPLDYICQLLGTDQDEANAKFAQQTLTALKEAKIHAEVQLLVYCELNPSLHPPRVICSSKDACYLCNSLITIFKKVHTPRCHGKIYPGWRLPHLPPLANVQKALNELLSRHVSSSLTSLLRARRRTVYPDPNESTLLTLQGSTSTVDTGEVARVVDSQPLPLDGPDAESMPGRETAKDAPTCLPGTATSKVDNSTRESTLTRPEDPPTKIESLTAGMVRVANIKLGAACQIFQAGPLKIHVEYSGAAGPSAGSLAGREATCTLERLTMEEVEMLRAQSLVRPIDIESLEAGIDVKIEHPDCFYLAAKRDILKLQFRRPSVLTNDATSIPDAEN